MRLIAAHRKQAGPRFGRPVIDADTDRELLARYLAGQISIGCYLDRRFGTAFTTVFGSAGARRVGG
ncbi:hypothetical protein [Actinophytocola sp. KF-1]